MIPQKQKGDDDREAVVFLLFCVFVLLGLWKSVELLFGLLNTLLAP